MAVFPVAEENAKILMSKSIESSAFQAAGVQIVPVSPLSDTVFTTVLGDTEWGTHAFGDEQDKQVSDTDATKVSVTMHNVYHAEYFDARQYGNDPQAVAAEAIARFQADVASAIDKYTFGVLDSAANPGFTGTPAEIDGTAESFLAAEDALSDAGYAPNATVLYNQAKSLVRSVLNEDTNRSAAAVALNDGITIGSTSAWFRRIATGALTDGQELGVVLDTNFVKIFVSGPTKVVVVTEDTDSTLSNKNAMYAKVEFRIGVAIVQDAAVPLVASLSDDEEEGPVEN